MDIAKKLADVVDMVYLSRDNAAFWRRRSRRRPARGWTFQGRRAARYWMRARVE